MYTEEPKNNLQQGSHKDEINIANYIDIIIRKKWLILTPGIALAITAGGLVLGNSLMWSIHKTTSVIDMGQGTQKIVSCADTADKIIRGYYLDIIKQRRANYFDFDTDGRRIDWGEPGERAKKVEEVFCSRNSLYLTIMSKTPREAEKFLNEIDAEILTENQKIYDVEKKLQEERLKILNDLVLVADTERKNLENKIAALTQKAYWQPASYQLSLLDTQIKLGEKKNEVNNLKQEILQLESEIGYINMKPPKIVIAPQSVRKSNGLQPLNSAMMGGISGIVMGLMLAFGIEGYKRNKMS